MVALVLVAALVNYFGGGSWGPVTFIQDAAVEILSPLQSAITAIYRSISSTWTYLNRIRYQEELIKHLQEHIMELERERIIIEAFRQENVRLRRLLYFNRRADFSSIGAHVIARSSDEGSRWIMINVGSLDGVEEKMPVITYHGILLGVINRVSWNWSQVLLINDPEFAVGGLVQRAKSREVGVVKGQLEDSRVLVMEKLAWDADVVEGDLIVTSYLSQYFPQEIPIGYVIQVEQEDYGLAKKAYVESPTSLQRIEEVLVLMTNTLEKGDHLLP